MKDVPKFNVAEADVQSSEKEVKSFIIIRIAEELNWDGDEELVVRDDNLLAVEPKNEEVGKKSRVEKKVDGKLSEMET
jgi:hypothetical protein